jgi:zinc transporter 9
MAEQAASFKAVLAAVAANSLVTVLKFVAFVLSGSGAMLSEAIHSLADTGNQLLLFVGLKRGSRAPDDAFHYGYGAERFVFGILSASGIFFVGCGVTVYHGVSGLLSPSVPAITVTTFAVLGVSLVVEGAALVFALRAAQQDAKGLPFREYLKTKADPATLAVLLEDSVAVLGLILASAGIAVTHFTGNPLWDSLGSIIVGLLLGGVAILLVLENRTLLLGRAAPDRVEAKFTELLRARASVRETHDIKTRQITPEIYMLKAEIAFDESFLAERIDALGDADLASMDVAARRELVPKIAALAARAIGDEIDDIEKQLREAIPEARHIDLEVDRGRAREP